MTIRHMRIFLEVYKTENITAAAARLHMTQPAVTRAIQEIERYYGVRLFERINRRLYITPSGEQLYAHALHITDSFDLMEKGLRNWDELGVLRVGASITPGNFLLPELAVRMREKRPLLRLHATVASGRQLTSALLDNRLDLAVIEDLVSDDHLHCEPFASDRLVLILPPDHPLCAHSSVNLAQLVPYPFLLREKGSVGRSFLDHVFAAHELPLSPIWESASTQAIVKAVAAGLGISILPEQLVRADLRSGSVVTLPIEDEQLVRTHAIVWHRHKFLTACAREFIALCHTYGGNTYHPDESA